MMIGDEGLIDALDRERDLFSRADEGKMLAMTEELVRRGVYPKETVDGNPNSVFEMVKGYGARWHLWRAPLACPLCAVDLRDHRVGPPYKREVLDSYGFRCPDCGGRFQASMMGSAAH